MSAYTITDNVNGVRLSRRVWREYLSDGTPVYNAVIVGNEWIKETGWTLQEALQNLDNLTNELKLNGEWE